MQRIKKSNIGFLFLLVCLIAILALKLATDTCFLLKGTYEHADDLNVDKLQYVTSETDVPNVRENLPRNIEKTNEAIESDSHLHKNENEQLSGKRLESRSPVITGEEEENIVSDGKIQAGSSKNKRFSADENVRPRAKRSWRIKRNWRNKRATNINGTHTYVFACQNGKVSRTSLIKSCMTKYRARKGIGCDIVNKAGWSIMYHEMLNYGASFDMNGAIDGNPRMLVSVNGEDYMLTCPPVIAKIVPSTKCYSDGALPIIINGKKAFKFRSGLLSKEAHEIPCYHNQTIESAVKRAAEFRLKTLISNELMSSFLFYELDKPFILSRIFDIKHIASIVLLEESFFSGAAADSYVTLFHVLWRKLSPYFFGGYAIFKIGWSVFMFVLAKAMKLNLTHAASFFVPQIKNILDLKKFVLEKRLSNNNTICKEYRKAQNRKKDAGVADITIEHLTSLYAHASEQSKRIAELERQVMELQGNSSASLTNVSESSTTDDSSGTITVKRESVIFNKT